MLDSNLKVPNFRTGRAPSYQQVIADDLTPAPQDCQDYTKSELVQGDVSREVYLSAEVAKAEVDHMWSRVWQFACREEQIAEPGDLVVYDSPGASFIIVRTDDGNIKAYYNSCLHRGMKLCRTNSSVAKLACPFHNFTWSLDGELIHVPARWDFPDLDASRMNLPEAKVGLWGGFVFINRNPDAPELLEYLGHVANHIPDQHFRQRRLTTIIRKKLRCNWKIGMDAFQEVFHIAGLHPQVLPIAGDSSVQYDVWPDDPHTSRFLEPTGIPSDEYPRDISEQDILGVAMRLAGSDIVPELPEGMRARQYLAAMVRDHMSQHDDSDYSGLSDSESNDGMQYTIFPNMLTFRNISQPWAYRFLPVRDNPELSVFELFILANKDDGSEEPEVQTIELDYDQSYQDAVVDLFSPMLADVLDQDVIGMEGCQEGLRDGGDAPLIFAKYQESRLRHFHQTLQRYLNGEL